MVRMSQKKHSGFYVNEVQKNTNETDCEADFDWSVNTQFTAEPPRNDGRERVLLAQARNFKARILQML